jgi:hypothetical protein
VSEPEQLEPVSRETRPDVPEVVGTGQAAAMLGISRDYLTRRLIPAGVVRPFAKMPGPTGAWLFTLEEVRRAAAAQATAAGNRWRGHWEAIARNGGAE